MNWLIIKTDFRKEHYVARQIQALTFDAWVPCEVRTQRICRHVKRRQTTHHPLIPRLIFAAVPFWAVAQGELDHIRHLVAVERNADQAPVSVPSSEIHAFRAAIDAENTAALALSQTATKKQKARWRNLKEALLETIEQAKQQMEQAA